MAKSARSPAQESRRSDWLEPLTDAVNRLTDEIRVARDVADEFRIDFAWLLQNGMPHQPREMVILKRMARDPLAEDWAQRLEVTRCPIPQSQRDQSSLSFDDLEAFAHELQTAFEGIAEGQLEIVLTALEEVRQRILAALPHRTAEPPDSPDATTSTIATDTQTAVSPSKQGELF